MFIDNYRNLPVLWDASDKLYANKTARSDALAVLGEKHSLDAKGVKNKIKSLRSYFSKETGIISDMHCLETLNM